MLPEETTRSFSFTAGFDLILAYSFDPCCNLFNIFQGLHLSAKALHFVSRRKQFLAASVINFSTQHVRNYHWLPPEFRRMLLHDVTVCDRILKILIQPRTQCLCADCINIDEFRGPGEIWTHASPSPSFIPGSSSGFGETFVAYNVWEINGICWGIVVLADSEYTRAIFHLFFFETKVISSLYTGFILEGAKISRTRCSHDQTHFVCMDSLGCVPFLYSAQWDSISVQYALYTHRELYK